MKIASGHFRLFVRNFSNFNSVQTVSILSGQFQNGPDGFNTVRTVSILSGHLQYCPDGFNTVRTASILSGQFRYCPDVSNTVRTASILSGWFQYCPDGLNAVWIVSVLSILSKLSGKFYYPLLYLARGDLRAFSYVATGDLRTFYMSREAYLRASSGRFLRVKSCCPESFRFLCLCRDTETQVHTVKISNHYRYISYSKKKTSMPWVLSFLLDIENVCG